MADSQQSDAFQLGDAQFISYDVDLRPKNLFSIPVLVLSLTILGILEADLGTSYIAQKPVHDVGERLRIILLEPDFLGDALGEVASESGAEIRDLVGDETLGENPGLAEGADADLDPAFLIAEEVPVLVLAYSSKFDFTERGRRIA
jgi:hypothetical protein